MWNMHDFYSSGVKQESDYLHHGGDGVGLDADSKFTKQDRMRSKKNRVRTPLLHSGGEHGQDWISCRMLAIFLDQDWIWIFIFEKN